MDGVTKRLGPSMNNKKPGYRPATTFKIKPKKNGLTIKLGF